MNYLPPIFLTITAITGIVGLLSVFWIFCNKEHAPSITPALVFIFPSTLLTILFYSLAFHMHRSLNGWPAVIGNEGFPKALDLHAQITMNYFSAILLINIIFLPVALLICGSFRQLRKFILCLGLFAMASSASYLIISIAPSEFLNWWWD